jgi:hypothetical protein
MTAFDRLLTPASTVSRAIPIVPVTARDFRLLTSKLSAPERSWIELHNYTAKPGSYLVVSNAGGTLAKVYFGLGEDGADRDPFEFGKLSRLLPDAEYRIDGELPDVRLSVLGWLLEAYSFDRYRKGGAAAAKLQCPRDVDRKEVLSAAESTGLVRDLIHRFHLGAGARSEGHAHRQGGLFRYRRPRHQAALGHAADEEGHGRRGKRPGPCADDHDRETQRAIARPHTGG